MVLTNSIISNFYTAGTLKYDPQTTSNWEIVEMLNLGSYSRSTE